MSDDRGFSVRGKRVVVVGGRRSGVAAAELLVRARARVTLTDLRDELADERRSAGGGRRARARRPSTGRRFVDADSIVLSPGVPPRQPAIEAARQRGVPVIGELELASRWLRGRDRRDHRHQGQVDDDDADRADAARPAGTVLVGGNIGHALSAQVDAVAPPTTIHVVEVEQLSARDHRAVSPVDCRAAELLAGSPRSTRQRRRIRARQGAHLREPDAPADWAVRQCGRSRGAGARGARDARAGCCSRCGTTSPRASSIGGDAIVRRTADGRRASRWCRSSSVRLLGPPPAGGRDGGGRRGVAGRRVTPTAMTRAVEGFTGLEHALEPVATSRRRAVRQRLEGHQRRGRAPGDRELRRRLVVDHGRPVQGRRLRRSRAAARRARARRWWRSARRAPLVQRGAGATRAGARCRDDGDAVRTAFARGAPGGVGAAGAGVRELRHVPRLRGAWPRVQAGAWRGCEAEWERNA